MTRVLMIDNYDSFTYNLVQYLGELGAEIDTVRNDAAAPDDLLAEGYDRLVVSPGPCTPNEAGISVEVMRRFPEAGVPALGVCLGHQSLAQAFGGRVVRHVPVHGKVTEIEHDATGLFADLPTPLTVGRYHSLVVDPELPQCLIPTARGPGVPQATADGEAVASGREGGPPGGLDVVMAVRHEALPAYGVQFHPESVLTPEGKHVLANFLKVQRSA